MGTRMEVSVLFLEPGYDTFLHGAGGGGRVTH
jgi:hypothetical protein